MNMLVKVYVDNVEPILLAKLASSDDKACQSIFLQNKFSITKIPPPDPHTLELLLKDICLNSEVGFYYCNDTDLFIEIASTDLEVLKKVEGVIVQICLKLEPAWQKEGFFLQYNCTENKEGLISVIREKMKEAPVEDSIASQVNLQENKEFSPNLTTEQSTQLRQAIQERQYRNFPDIMIVEDQVFTQRLLLNILGNLYKCITVEKGAEAIEKYARFAPDIVLLDIGIPDINGHELATFLKDIDPNAYIIMVTANNYAKDVKSALDNSVKGYIVKPFTKDKILDTIAKFKRQ
jgi:two-component system chemotaxis response regulator CheY